MSKNVTVPFSYQDQEYNAAVLITYNPTQLHVSNIFPEGLPLPESFIVTLEDSGWSYSFRDLNPTQMELVNHIILAAQKVAGDHKIDLYTDS